MKKILLSAFVVLTFGAYSLHERQSLASGPAFRPVESENPDRAGISQVWPDQPSSPNIGAAAPQKPRISVSGDDDDDDDGDGRGEDGDGEENGVRATSGIKPPTARNQSETTTAPSGDISAPQNAPADSVYKDGSYTGTATDAYYGFVQVKAVVKSGKLADVVFLQYPNDRQTSISINQQAMPILKSEAITAQRADVDIVSGATQTSIAFNESLASALAQAKI